MPFVDRPDGARLYYEIAGDPRRTPIALLGGLGDDLSGWRRNVPHLAAELLVVAYDQRGNGRSDAADAPATMTTYAGDCVAVLDELRIERSHLYGRSFGGMVALELTLSHPERVRSAILAATNAGPARAIRSSGRAPKDRPWLQLYAPAFAEAHPERVAEDLRARRRRPEGEHAQWDAMRSWDVRDRLGEVSVPVLVLHGSEDRLIDPANAALLAERIPGAELAILEGAGHLYHAEQPERSDEIVLEFVRRNRA